MALLGCNLRTVLYTVLKTCSTHLQVVNVAEGVHYLLPIPDFREHKRDWLSSGNRQDLRSCMVQGSLELKGKLNMNKSEKL